MKPKIIIIAGPTAVGKTDISIKLAHMLDTEIISADSMQIYKRMDIGSAKISPEEMSGVPHHMIDIIEPWESFSVADFKEQSEKIISSMIQHNKIPLIVGGTGLYIDSLICNYNFTDANKDENYRLYLENLANEKGAEYIFHMLQAVDFEASLKIHKNNVKRVIRALEVYKLTGKPFSQFEIDESAKYDIPYDVLYFVLTMKREALYNRINYRVDKMLELGLIEEVKQLKSFNCNADMQSMKGIGYKELLYYLDDKYTLEEAIESIKKGSRNYAKRQLTWFRKDSRVHWIEKENFRSDNDILTYMINLIKK